MKTLCITFIALMITSVVWAGSPRTFTNADLEEKWGGDNTTVNEANPSNGENALIQPSQDSNLESVFKEQLAGYNREIQETNEQAKYYAVKWGETISLEGRDGKKFHDKMRLQADDYIEKEKRLKERRAELKTKVVEKFGTLPSWWSEN